MKYLQKTHATKASIILLLFVLSLTNICCKKFVDIKPNSRVKVIENANDVQLLLNNYADLNTIYPSDGEASSDDYYLNENGYSSVEIEDQDIYTWKPDAIRKLALPQWQSPYYAVYQANLALGAIEKLKGKESDAVLNPLKGQALFFRAYAFWNIAQLYCKPYVASTASADPGIPIRLKATISDKSSRGTVQQTYDQIINDLKESVNLLDVKSTVAPSRPTKTAAYAMLARVYLSMEYYPEALSNASAVLLVKHDLMDYNGLDDATSSTPFHRFNPEVIFQSITLASLLLDPGADGSAIARINDDLYASYAENDLRKSVFFKPNIMNATLPDAGGDGVDLSLPDGTYRFSGNYNETSGSELFNGLAVDEMYLIRAECYARAGNKELAMADLKTLMVNRWKKDADNKTTYIDPTVNTLDQALNIILTERRKELVMRGQRWTDARRLKLSLTRQTKTVTFSGTADNPIRQETVNNIYNLPVNDPRFTLLIPKEVIDNTGLSQNSR